MLGKDTVQRKRIFLNVNKEGKIVRTENGNKEYYSEITGVFDKVEAIDRTYGGETVKVWYITLTDGDEEYKLAFSYSSGVFKSIIMSLDSIRNTIRDTPVRIAPYVSNGFVKVTVYQGDKKLSWSGTLPSTEEVELPNGRKIKDDSERMRYIETIVSSLNVSGYR